MPDADVTTWALAEKSQQQAASPESRSLSFLNKHFFDASLNFGIPGTYLKDEIITEWLAAGSETS